MTELSEKKSSKILLKSPARYPLVKSTIIEKDTLRDVPMMKQTHAFPVPSVFTHPEHRREEMDHWRVRVDKRTLLSHPALRRLSSEQLVSLPQTFQ